jgi:hypothetical protein
MCVRKTPLADVFYFLPGNGARKGLDGWPVVDDDDYNQSVGEPQAEGMMSTAARLFPQLETKVDRSGEEQTND